MKFISTALLFSTRFKYGNNPLSMSPAYTICHLIQGYDSPSLDIPVFLDNKKKHDSPSQCLFLSPELFVTLFFDCESPLILISNSLNSYYEKCNIRTHNMGNCWHKTLCPTVYPLVISVLLCEGKSLWVFTTPNSSTAKRSQTVWDHQLKDTVFYFCQRKVDILTLSTLTVSEGGVRRHWAILSERCMSIAQQTRASGKKCKVGGKSLALFACSLSITCLPSLAEQWEKEKIRSMDNNLSLAFGSRMHVASKSLLSCSCLNYNSAQPLPRPNHKATFHGEGDVDASALWQNYCSFHLSIFIIVQFPPTASLSRARFMTRSPSASSERRCVHHRDFSQASVLFNPKAGEEEEEEGGWQTER